MSHVMRLGLLILVAAALGAPAPAHADHVTAVTVIDADHLKRWIDRGKSMTLVDSRVAAESKAGHIPTAPNILSTTMDQHKGRLPASKQAATATCSGCATVLPPGRPRDIPSSDSP